MQRVSAKERVSQSKSLDLQSQLSRAKTELSQLQKSKEEVQYITFLLRLSSLIIAVTHVVSLCFRCFQMERRFQTQLQNMKDRLEQSDSTNRSLQNYVHFLKTSYGNVFGDSLLAS